MESGNVTCLNLANNENALEMVDEAFRNFAELFWFWGSSVLLSSVAGMLRALR
jgi:hypothetical protein